MSCQHLRAGFEPGSTALIKKCLIIIIIITHKDSSDKLAHGIAKLCCRKSHIEMVMWSSVIIIVFIYIAPYLRK